MSHTVASLLREGAQQLERVGIDGAARDAKRLLAHAFDVEPVKLVLIDPPIADDKVSAFFSLIDCRARRVPVSHLLGQREFWGRMFTVDANVLDPRPETETLIEAALNVPFQRILDMGTGTGCILLTLLAEREGAKGVGTDISEGALQTARENSLAHELVSRAEFLQSDWFEIVKGPFDLIVSNPPYIAAEEMAGLGPELAYEPRLALTDEGDGLSCYRIIAAGAPAHLGAGGWLMVEIGPTQGTAVRVMFEAAGLINTGIRSDLDGRDRVVVGQKPL